MKKKLFSILIFVAVIFVFFQKLISNKQQENPEKSASDHTTSEVNEVSTEASSSEKDRDTAGASASTTSTNPDSKSEVAKISDIHVPKGDRQAGSNENAEEKPYSRLFAELYRELDIRGFSPQIGECLEIVVNKNLERDFPLSFDGMSEYCAKENSLDPAQIRKLNVSFRKAINSSRRDVVLNQWHECSSKKKFPDTSTCLGEIYYAGVRTFYERAKGEGDILSGQLFQNLWGIESQKIIQKVINTCPKKDWELLREVYAYEC